MIETLRPDWPHQQHVLVVDGSPDRAHRPGESSGHAVGGTPQPWPLGAARTAPVSRGVLPRGGRRLPAPPARRRGSTGCRRRRSTCRQPAPRWRRKRRWPRRALSSSRPGAGRRRRAAPGRGGAAARAGGEDRPDAGL